MTAQKIEAKKIRSWINMMRIATTHPLNVKRRVFKKWLNCNGKLAIKLKNMHAL
jgi:hypothetical protein